MRRLVGRMSICLGIVLCVFNAREFINGKMIII